MGDNMASDEMLVRVESLVKYFIRRGGTIRRRQVVIRAVDGVSLNIESMHTLGLVGESGCGKTTLGRCILRLIEPTRGKVTFEGKDLISLPTSQLRELRRNMQIVFQNPYSSLDPRMSVLNIVSEPLRAHTSLESNQIHKQVIQLLEQVGMSADYLYRNPHEFSGGQLQRIAIARTLALSPKFIVLDEPTAALDVSVQAQIISLLMELQRNLKLTYLFISHNLPLVYYLSDSIAVMYLGKIVEYAGASEIFEHPLHPYTEALLSATPSIDPLSRRQRIILTGRVPDPANPPLGCSFNPRCSKVMDICHQTAPQLTDLGDGHLVSCYLYN
jgi:oligopeptide transport system ATP-binding protein